MTTLSVLIASLERRTLARAIESAVGADEVLVDVNKDGDGGNAGRNRLMPQATGDWLLFMDDDDVYAPDAIPYIRQQVSKLKIPCIFRMQYADGRKLWRQGVPSPALALGNVGTPMIVVPNDPARLGQWVGHGCGDFRFIWETVGKYDGHVVWDRGVIALVRPR